MVSGWKRNTYKCGNSIPPEIGGAVRRAYTLERVRSVVAAIFTERST